MTDWLNSDVAAGEVVSIAAVAYVFYDSEVRSGGSLSWCNCNPGNIVVSGEADSYGAYQGVHNYRFAVFPDETTGHQAVVSFLSNPIRSSKTITQMMAIYAPAGDGPNSPQAYADRIVQALGDPVTADTPVNTLSGGQLDTMASAIQNIEGWQEGPQPAGPDDLPDDLANWLNTYPGHDDRQQADQPYADTKAPPSPGIANLQNLLNTTGANPALIADGKFGPASHAAVVAFQQGQGLTADGIAGTGTWQALLATTGG
jgi:hypothetical protein